MPLDGIYLYSLKDELCKKIIGSRVDKISQPEKDEIVLNLRVERTSYKLLVSASSTYPKVHLTNINKVNPIKAPMFCMVLRKYLSNGKIVSISQLDTDRILIIDFESADELGFNSVYSMIIEIMGRHSNITLIRQRDSVIIDSIKHITPDINSYRSLYPGIKFVYPPSSTKLSPFNFNYQDLSNFIELNFIKFEPNMFSKIFTGISSPFAKSIAIELEKNNIALNLTRLKEIFIYILNLFEGLRTSYFEFISYKFGDSLKDFYCIKLHQYSGLSEKVFSSPSELIESFYYEKDKSDRLNIKSSDLQKIIHTNIDRCNKKLELLKGTLIECDSRESYKISGELLTANIYNIKKGMKEVRVLNYYAPNEDYINIPIDENKTPSENIQGYYKKYNKLKKSAEMAELQIKAASEELDYLQSVLTNIKNAESYEEIEEIKRELIDTGYIRFKKEDKKKFKSSKPMHFLASNGEHIYIGKNNIQNDFLTLKFADKKDIWLHTKNIPGSHVIIKSANEVSKETIEEAAILAAYYSKGKDSTKVPVDYTEVRNVKKPSGAKPGMVIYYTNKTIYVNPEKLELQKID
ncbi:Rqc2 family fibronectin-binding protein [Candidatus Clostridium radicumherbarum]|uniref:Rqc2 homolog RqcH n=1 Tax=Candidatus Clostridium radicumherbarum TaxID=3381662 RepID=A0ABW8TV49_9CLOT